MTTEEIKREALQLPKDQWLTLAHNLLSSIEPEKDERCMNAWDAEIRDRIRRYDEGSVASIPALAVVKELDRRLAE